MTATETPPAPASATTQPALADVLQRAREGHRADPYPSRAERVDRLHRLNNALLDYQPRLIEAVAADFGCRPESETMLAELIPLHDSIKFHSKRIRRWMRPERRRAALTLQPARLAVKHQPVGVVGIVSPWNFPIFLALSPLIGALAAGNSAVLKLSELAPRTAEVVRELVESTFDPTEVGVVTGDAAVAAEFTALPFDHLVFTGSTDVGRKVMAAAAQNLTPVTLELGGKSPALIHPSYSVSRAAERLAWGKGLNAGQVCVSPDYVLCPTESVNAFCDAYLAAAAAAYPDVETNDDYTGIINERQAQRLHDYIVDAQAKGASVRSSADSLPTSGSRIPMTVLTGVTDDMRVMEEEIFGPLLPVVGYDTPEEAISFINNRPRPLALYYFDNDRRRAADILETTHSGGVCINDTMNHVLADDLPFGGVGASGIGHYHGHEGFKTFSKAKPVLRRGAIAPALLIGPPWGRTMHRAFNRFQAMRLRRLRTAQR